MAIWKQSQEQPFTTYRDPQTGQWIVKKPARPVECTLVEASLYRDPQTGRWIVEKPSRLIQSTFARESL